jgi:hypothetical protein
MRSRDEITKPDLMKNRRYRLKIATQQERRYVVAMQFYYSLSSI